VTAIVRSFCPHDVVQQSAMFVAVVIVLVGGGSGFVGVVNKIEIIK